MNENEIRTYSKDWYTLGRNFLPEFNTPLFGTMAGKSNAFSYQVSPKAEGINIRLTKDVDTAYVDLKTKTIYISEKYFSSELYANRYEDGKTDTEELAIALINGSVIHEALHIEHTTVMGTIVDALKLSSKYDEMIGRFGTQVCCTAFNIIEDLYIEAHVPEQLEKWLQGCSDIIFPEAGMDDIDLSLENIGDFLNLGVYFKNKVLRGNDHFNAFSEKALHILNEVSDPTEKSGIRTRVRKAFDWLNEFQFEAKMTEEEKSDTSSSSSKSEMGEGETSEIVQEILDAISEMTEEEFEKLDEEISESSDEIMEKEKKTEIHSSEMGTVSWKRLIEKDVLELRERLDPAHPTSDINFSFLKELVGMRTLNRTPGQARTSGSVMVKSRLARIATDGKIFAKQDAQRQTIKRLEVIINIDFSGSTSGRVLNNELGAAMEMSKVLRAAGIAHSVYGHTSYNGREIPLLFHIYSYDMQVTNQDWDARFERARRVNRSENYDGVVIKRLGDKFTGKQAAKYVINLSDGSPAGYNYYGSPANDHTKIEIQNLRNKGIGVFAISVVSHVVRRNDKIYGTQFNIDGSSDVTAQFRGLIKRLVS